MSRPDGHFLSFFLQRSPFPESFIAYSNLFFFLLPLLSFHFVLHFVRLHPGEGCWTLVPQGTVDGGDSFPLLWQ